MLLYNCVADKLAFGTKLEDFMVPELDFALLRQRGRSGLPAQLRRRGVSEETFAVALAGRRWALPHLPFRAIKAIQPALFAVYADAGGDAMSTASVAQLGEAQFERLAEATWRAIAVVDPALDATKTFSTCRSRSAS